MRPPPPPLRPLPPERARVCLTAPTGRSAALGAALIAALATALAACGDPDAPLDDAPDALADADPAPEPEPVPEPCDGLDLDGDGRCDREAADWSATARIEPGTDRRDIFALGDALPEAVTEGLGHAQVWPVDVSGILMPYAAVGRALDPDADDPTLIALRRGAADIVGFETLPGFYTWLGLPPYDPPAADGPFARLPYAAPRPPGVPDGAPMAVGVIPTESVDALTFSCTACHAGRLLGRTVVGLANRRARANSFFRIARQMLPVLSSPLLLDLIDVTEDEAALIERTLSHARNVEAVDPLALGLDTSLAQVALSLARRGDDPYAEPDRERQLHPLPNALSETPADSKPMPWWTLKYKTRWLADGSITAGNPVLTNFLWNELGRGTDLRALERWMQANRRVIDTLTVAVFASEPPRWTDFFAPETIDLPAARRGQSAFAARCARCHGTYEKAWDAPDAESLDPIARLATTRVVYHARTPVLDVGTDPARAAGMAHFGPRLNDLAISRWMQTTVEVQRGYVPPPLDGIWARYPYLHNNSVPTLCALLTLPADRPTTFRQGPSEDAATDFDADCVGYPIGDAIPPSWAEGPEAEVNLVDTRRPGLSNAGHAEMLDGRDGNPPLTAEERADLVMFLKTL